MVVGGIQNKMQRILVRLLLVAAIVFCAYHAFSSYQVLGNDIGGDNLTINLVRTPLIVEIEESKRKAQKLNASLDYLVWREEKAKVSDLLRQEIRRNLNLEPYDANSWNTFNAIEHIDASVLDDRLWSLRNALTFNAWSQKQRLRLSYYCILQDEQLSRSMRDDCTGVLGSLPFSRGTDWLAVHIGIDRSILAEALSRFGLAELTGLK